MTSGVIRTLVTVAGVLALAGPGAAQQSRTPPRAEPSGQASKLPSSARAFMVDAARGNLSEVELGKLAQERASNDAVKQFAQRMVSDHGNANQDLATLAQQKGVTLPDKADHASTKGRLQKLSAPGFDREYVSEMLRDHKKDVAEFRKQAEHGSDPDVKAWAAKTLPTLEEHLKLVEDLEKNLKS